MKLNIGLTEYRANQHLDKINMKFQIHAYLFQTSSQSMTEKSKQRKSSRTTTQRKPLKVIWMAVKYSTVAYLFTQVSTLNQIQWNVNQTLRFCPSKGSDPLTKVYSTTPKLQTSTSGPSYFLPVTGITDDWSWVKRKRQESKINCTTTDTLS